MPYSSPEPHQRVAAALLGATRVVVLAGRFVGRPDDDAPGAPSDAWANRASLEMLLTEPQSFWEFTLPAATAIAARRPTGAHAALARLQRAGIVRHIISQSVDHLLVAEGATDVSEVHGSILSAICTRCGERYGLAEVERLVAQASDSVPRCTSPDCGYPLRPSSTLWGEPLVESAVKRAWDEATECDLFVVIDSDLRAVPMSLLPSVPLTRDVPLIMIGTIPTQYDRYASVLIREESEPVLVKLADLVAPEDG